MDVRIDRPIPDRPFFKIGEVAQILGVAPSAVRYWQHEFWPHVHPAKTRTQQHVFSKRDVTVLAIIRTLVHDEGNSIRDARERLAALLAEHDGDVAFVDVGQGVLPLAGPDAPADSPRVDGGFLARLEDLQARLAETEHRARLAEDHATALEQELALQTRERERTLAEFRRLVEAIREEVL